MLKGHEKWPTSLEEQDWLVFLVDSFRDILALELPPHADDASSEVKKMIHNAKGLIGDLAAKNEELARTILIADASGNTLPTWFLTQVVRDLPNLAIRSKK